MVASSGLAVNGRRYTINVFGLHLDPCRSPAHELATVVRLEQKVW
jgi:hypothetical protein